MSTLFAELYNRETVEGRFNANRLLELLKEDPVYRVAYKKMEIPKNTELNAAHILDEHIHFLEKGIVAYEYEDQIISFSSEGDILGMNDIFIPKANKYNVRTITKTIIYTFSKQDVLNNIFNMQEGWLFLYLNNQNYNILVAEKYMLMRQIGKTRLKNILMDIAEKYGYQDGDRIKIPGCFTRKDIANYANLSMNSMSQICKMLENEQFCVIKAKQFILLNKNTKNRKASTDNSSVKQRKD
ncbi:hypothetical protein BMT55_06865 [Listeria newyorkensis]|uniref:Crp/Fnr family transcriptional regulator n=1 Tax=Listeria newyorkensis TaxID=1497681 RepID=A0ABX4XNJ7_9LIST|nr:MULTISPECIES: Crp/Fnr family transcriptional regulator [Listeria]KGL42273.1 hypothetical protein EP56_08635 [Listeriaceae bacterium FSL A5-0209]KGL38703.1 hypothetical protein EP58_14810 [Listeria newyorkensis]KMT62225.1 hypothetical protein X559_1387 [Listeria newyorkensis]PNP92676.1 hypothetical protein BMT55_06865 [Listeria newyorkensis]RQW66473.1 Crp/Fnr family transcriptional regulator [Listeria sp. SHR_NRA_18]